MRKSALIFVFVVFVMFAGCEATRGAAKGAQLDLQTAHRGAMKCWQALKSIDDWVQRDLW